MNLLNTYHLKLNLFIVRTLFDKFIAVFSIIGSIVLVLSYLNLFNLDLEKHQMIILINIAALQGWLFFFRALTNLLKSILVKF